MENKKITIEDFKKVDIVVGKILSVEKIPNTDKLLKLSVDLGESNPRQIVSGISLYFPDCNILIGKKCIFLSNLESRKIYGIESQGMILAISTEDNKLENKQGKFSLLETNDEIPVGARVK